MTAPEIKRAMVRLEDRGLLRPLLEMSRKFNVSAEDVLGRVNTKRVTECRAAFFFHLHERCGLSDPEIAILLDRDRSGVYHARRRHMERNGEAAPTPRTYLPRSSSAKPNRGM